MSSFFFTLREHLPSFLENFLTQSFKAVFDHSPEFRREFVKLLQELGGAWVQPISRALKEERLTLQTQIVHADERWRTIPDAELRVGGRHVCAIEVKLDSPQSARQLQQRAKTLTARGIKPRFLLIARVPDLSNWPDAIRRLTTPLSWGNVLETVARVLRRKHVTAHERWLLEQWSAHLMENGIVSPAQFAAYDWSRLELLARMLKGERGWVGGRFANESVTRTFQVSQTVVSRLEAHRERAWLSLAGEGFRPYSFVAPEHGEDGAIKNVHMSAGYFMLPKRKPGSGVKSVSLVLGLELLPKPVLTLWAGAHLSSKHPKYSRGNAYIAVPPLKGKLRLPPKQTRALFEQPIGEAHEHIAEWMSRALVSFQGGTLLRRFS